MMNMRNSAAYGIRVRRIENLLHVSGYEFYIYRHRHTRQISEEGKNYFFVYSVLYKYKKRDRSAKMPNLSALQCTG